MGCFCGTTLLSMPPLLLPPPPVDLSLRAELHVPLLAGISDWLAARWLPPSPGLPAWEPDPAWLSIQWPTVPMPAAGLGVLLSLVMAHQRIQATLGLDMTLAGDVFRLGRIIATLNLRRPQLDLVLRGEWRAWQGLAQLNAQIDMVQAAIVAGLLPRVDLVPPLVPSLALGPWRGVLAQIKLLAPLIALAQLLKLDLANPASLDVLAVLVRKLRLVVLPRLADLSLVLGLVARNDAILRLQASLGATLSFPQMRAAVALKARAVLALLPPGLRLEGGRLTGMPVLPPNPGLLLNVATMAQARLLTPQFTARLNWQVPAFAKLPLLTIGTPVASLVAGLVGLGLDPIRLSPCGPVCDARRALA